MSEFLLWSGLAVQLFLAVCAGWWFKERFATAATLKDEQLQQLWNRMQEVSAGVALDVDEHAKRVDHLSHELDELQSSDQEEPQRRDAEREIIAQILAANKQLHDQLAASERRIQEHMQTIQNMSSETRVDPVTRLANRRAFDDEFPRHCAAWQQRRTPLSLVLVGVDRFREIATQAGQQAADEVLCSVSQALAETVRDMDVVARYGDAQFIIVLPDTALDGGLVLAERVRAAVEACAISSGEDNPPVFVSVGVTEICEGDDMKSFLDHAELALDAAQQNGPNRAYFYNGRGCLPIVLGADGSVVRGESTETAGTSPTRNELRIHARRMFLRTEMMAPYIGERLPPRETYVEIQCFDISVGGISFFLPKPPEHQKYVLALGQGSQALYAKVEVVRVAMTKLHTMPMYVVGCKFTGRIQAPVKAPAVPAGAAV